MHKIVEHLMSETQRQLIDKLDLTLQEFFLWGVVPPVLEVNTKNKGSVSFSRASVSVIQVKCAKSGDKVHGIDWRGLCAELPTSRTNSVHSVPQCALPDYHPNAEVREALWVKSRLVTIILYGDQWDWHLIKQHLSCIFSKARLLSKSADHSGQC